MTNSKKKAWIDDAWSKKNGHSLTIETEKLLEEKKTDFQKIQFYKSKLFGNILLLDGVINVTEFDEFSYHEMIAHVPLFSHENPENILIIGGGDGGALREVLKHRTVKSVDLCEIDKEVIELSKKYFIKTAKAFDDRRVKTLFCDGAKYVAENKNNYDVIIVDSSDPWGPAEILFKKKFYQNMFDALKKNGIAVTQSESMFFDKKVIKNLFSFNKNIFPIVQYYYSLVPTYPSGTIGFSFCSKKQNPLDIKKDTFKKRDIKNLQYYNYEIHKSSFALPNFMKTVSK